MRGRVWLLVVSSMWTNASLFLSQILTPNLLLATFCCLFYCVCVFRHVCECTSVTLNFPPPLWSLFFSPLFFSLYVLLSSVFVHSHFSLISLLLFLVSFAPSFLPVCPGEGLLEMVSWGTLQTFWKRSGSQYQPTPANPAMPHGDIPASKPQIFPFFFASLPFSLSLFPRWHFQRLRMFKLHISASLWSLKAFHRF